MKFLLDLSWVFNLQNCHSNPHCSHKLDSSVSQASFLKQKPWSREHNEKRTRSWPSSISYQLESFIPVSWFLFPPGSVRCSARKRICCRMKYLSKRKYTLLYRLVFINDGISPLGRGRGRSLTSILDPFFWRHTCKGLHKWTALSLISYVHKENIDI